MFVKKRTCTYLSLLVAGAATVIGIVVYTQVRNKNIENYNKNIVQQTHDRVWSEGDLALIDELYESHYVGHWATGTDSHGLDELKKIIIESRTNIPDLTESVELIIAEGNFVATYFRSSGTFSGFIEGNYYSNKKVSTHEMAIYRIAGGKIAEQWTIANNLLAMQQLGMELKPANNEVN